ncbi:MAG: TetR/AcrR family transcriptional regulator [Clostridiales bacterium]|nr:TetR/AcrR family transcriptional regulator [Candidatus Scatonaster coprocaballi]
MPRSREQNAQIREATKTNILQKSVDFFARNGVEGTKIGDLAKGIGISQGAIYVYFDSKEELYQDVVNFSQEKIITEEFLQIDAMDVPAVRKLRYISDYILKHMNEDRMYASYLLLALEHEMKKPSDHASNPMYSLMHNIIKEGQKDGAFAKGDVDKTTDYFWSVVYIYSVKKCNNSKCVLLNSSELERVVRG